MAINYRTDEEIDKIRAANQIVSAALDRLEEIVRPGVTTAELDREAEKIIKKMGGRPSFKGYRGFPNALCVAVNEGVVHGIPGSYALKEGDIIGLDLGAEKDGYYGDSARTLPVGAVSPEAGKIIKVTRDALMKGISQIRPGGHVSDISNAVQTHAESQGFSVVTSFVGHGIGSQPHEDPQVPNFGRPGRGPALRKGMVLAIEPMINAGTAEVVILRDGWTVKTSDGALSAHFEHSVAVTAEGYEILSISQK
ncbi:MAG: type I methionyl aminopeptidase [Nitrospinae bacterium]|nr:type I methionyl aminopeptidase [Nitrospinota bacterium]